MSSTEFRAGTSTHHYPANRIADDSLTRVSLDPDSSNSAAFVYDVRKQCGDDTAKSESKLAMDWLFCRGGVKPIRLSAIVCGGMQLLVCNIET